MINFITVCTESYTAEYANKSLSMFKRNCNIPFSAFCITDKASHLDDNYTTFEKNPSLKGWWNKMSIFEKELEYTFTVYCDLDLLIVNDLSEVINYACQVSEEVACFGDHIGWKNEKFGSAFMIYEQAKMHWLYEKFIDDVESNMLTEGGDQIWLGKHLNSVCYLEEIFPKLVKSLKFDLATIEDSGSTTNLQLPATVSQIDAMLLNCHGRPKPHELRHLGWPPINEIWT